MKHRPNLYAVPGLPFQIRRENGGKKPILEIIARIFEVEEGMILARGIPGCSMRKYTKPRQLYFYIMREIKRYSWHQLIALTGNSRSSMQYDVAKAKERMKDRQFLTMAELVLYEMKINKVNFPELITKLEADVKVIES